MEEYITLYRDDTDYEIRVSRREFSWLRRHGLIEPCECEGVTPDCEPRCGFWFGTIDNIPELYASILERLRA